MEKGPAFYEQCHPWVDGLSYKRKQAEQASTQRSYMVYVPAPDPPALFSPDDKILS